MEDILCARCNLPMEKTVLPRYEYVEGVPLHNVESYRCGKCGSLFFTEEQAEEMERRTREIEEYRFGFERKVTVSGKSLVVSIPHELVEHLALKQGQKVRVIPVAQEGFLVQKEIHRTGKLGRLG